LVLCFYSSITICVVQRFAWCIALLVFRTHDSFYVNTLLYYVLHMHIPIYRRLVHILWHSTNFLSCTWDVPYSTLALTYNVDIRYSIWFNTRFHRFDVRCSRQSILYLIQYRCANTLDIQYLVSLIYLQLFYHHLPSAFYLLPHRPSAFTYRIVVDHRTWVSIDLIGNDHLLIRFD
jgi:hypothetical protein